VIAAAVPPRQLDSSAIATPIHSVMLIPWCVARDKLGMEAGGTNSAALLLHDHDFGWRQVSAGAAVLGAKSPHVVTRACG
jgi:hypothetical protein